MTVTTIDTISNIIESLESKSEWRHEVSTRFPDDERNEEAAEDLQQFADEIRALAKSGAEICRQVEDLENELEHGPTEGAVYELWREFDEELTGAGFRGGFSSGASLLEWYYEKLQEIRQQQIDEENDNDDGVAAPGLMKQIEDDPAVKAAKLAYDEARAKAYAEARRRS
jgi:hypothetical protein